MRIGDGMGPGPLLLLALGCLGACSGEEPFLSLDVRTDLSDLDSCSGGRFLDDCAPTGGCGLDAYSPLPDSDLSRLVFVNGACPSDSPDGSLWRPFPTVQRALDVVKPGRDMVWIAEGDYDGPVSVPSSTHVTGAGRDRTRIHAKDGKYALGLMNASDSSVQSLAALGGSEGAMLVMDSDAVSLSGLRLTSVPTDTNLQCPAPHASSGQGSAPCRMGLVVYHAQEVHLDDLLVEGNIGHGVQFTGSGGSMTACVVRNDSASSWAVALALFDASTVTVGPDTASQEDAGVLGKGGCVFEGPYGLGILVQDSTLTARATLVEGFDEGGIVALSDPEAGTASVNAEHCLIQDVGRTGFFADNANATLDSIEVESVRDIAGQKDSAHCLVVTGNRGPSSLALLNSRVQQCSGVGVLLDQEVSGEIRQNQVSDAGKGGIWLQGHVQGVLAGNNVRNVQVVGIGVMAFQPCASLECQSDPVGFMEPVVDLEDNWVQGTRMGFLFDYHRNEEVEMGDAMVTKLYGEGGQLTLKGNRFLESDRAGLILDGVTAAQLYLGSNVAAGNAVAGLVLQGGSESMTDAKLSFDFNADSPLPNGVDCPSDVTLMISSFIDICMPPECTDVPR